MNNPLQQMLNKQAPQQPQQAGNPLQMLQQFKEFASGMNPEQAHQKVNQLVQNGQISQNQLNGLVEQAKGLMKLMR